LEYNGNVSTTVSGKVCQRWDSQTPHKHKFADALPGNASMHENYCRNPPAKKAAAGPWCYTMENATRWELCDIPYCGNSILFSLMITVADPKISERRWSTPEIANNFGYQIFSFTIIR
jgi:hypothetical protein